MMKLNSLFCFVQNFNSVIENIFADSPGRFADSTQLLLLYVVPPVPRLPVSRAALSRVSVTPIRARGVLLLKYAAQSSVPPLPPLATPAPRVSLLSSVSRSSASFATTSTGDGLAPPLSLSLSCALHPALALHPPPRLFLASVPPLLPFATPAPRVSGLSLFCVVQYDEYRRWSLSPRYTHTRHSRWVRDTSTIHVTVSSMSLAFSVRPLLPSSAAVQQHACATGLKPFHSLLQPLLLLLHPLSLLSTQLTTTTTSPFENEACDGYFCCGGGKRERVYATWDAVRLRQPLHGQMQRGGQYG